MQAPNFSIAIQESRSYGLILLFWLLFTIYLTFHYPFVWLNHNNYKVHTVYTYYKKKMFESNRNSITNFVFAF